nr:hypothetical protein [Tanacetum cinerariifolium]
MELDEHAPVYVLEPQHPEYHAPSDDDFQVEHDDEDLEEDPMRSMSLRVLRRLNCSRRMRLLSHHHHLDTMEQGYLSDLRHPLAMSSNNAQSAVTYTSISSDSDRPSWGIPLMNAGELSEMDPYEEVAQQG